MTIWCDGCRRAVSLDKWVTVFRAAPVFTQQGKRLGYVETRRHAACRTVVHLPVANPAQARRILTATD